jgi:hypothetical protein
MPDNEGQVRSRLPKLARQMATTTPVRDQRLLRRLSRLVNAYAAEVDCAELASGSKAIYIEMADCFVRWIGGQFSPGINGVCYSERQSAKRVRRSGVRQKGRG